MQKPILEQLLQDRAGKRAVALATHLATGKEELIYPSDKEQTELAQQARIALREDKARTVETAGGEVFINVFNSPLRLLIAGAVHIAQPLAQMAAVAGYDVTIIDPRRAFATAERFPGVALLTEWPDAGVAELRPDARTAIVTLTHDPKLDDAALSTALNSDSFYIGCLGSKKTHAARLERLRRAGFGDAALARIHGPVGLAIGAKSPAEIAISILAQMTSILRGGAVT
ncbi:MAG: xanthine dehydrogenase [Alphaproteobacteria bacterium]|nr:xanthine dehydrogenase [Alphaproteobacteria bacterium]